MTLTYLLIGFALAFLVAFAAYKVRALNLSGMVGAVVLGTIIFGIGGIEAALVLLLFFISSSVLSAVGKRHKSDFQSINQKGSRRDAGQVIANGGVAGTIILIGMFFPGDWVWISFCASLAAANADTWATEIGAYSKVMPRSLRTLQYVQPGASGGITPIGTLAAFSGAMVIALLGWLLRPAIGWWIWVIAVAGLFGSIVDSWLGASLQAIYWCGSCAKETERHPYHSCGNPTVLKRGFHWIDNDVVNAVCTLSAVIFVVILLVVLGQG